MELIKEAIINESGIKKLKLNWGKEYRPLWNTLANLSPNQIIKWIDRFSPLESIASEWAFCLLFENALKIKITERAHAIRLMFCELQRIIWSLDYLVNLFKALGDDFRKEFAIRIREEGFEIQEILTGARILPQILCIGGVERDLVIGEARKLRTLIQHLHMDLRQYLKDLPQDYSVMSTLSKFLVISKKEAIHMGIRGPFGEASGFSSDLRIHNPYGKYLDLEIKSYDPVKGDDWFFTNKDQSIVGDGLHRLMSVIFQLKQSLILVEKMSTDLPNDDYRVGFQEKRIDLDGFWTMSVEGSAGPISANSIRRKYFISNHSMRLAPQLENLLIKKVDIDQIDLAIASLGFDFAQGDLWQLN